MVTFLLLLSLVYQSIGTSKESSDKHASVTTTDLAVDAKINLNDKSITIDITYSGGTNKWFGIVWNDKMFGDAIVYTTGKFNDVELKLYAYDLTDMSTSNVNHNPEKDWEEIETDTTNGIVNIIYKQDLSKTDWTEDTDKIEFKYAIGNTLKLEYHTFRSNDVYTLNFDESDSSDSSDDESIPAMKVKESINSDYYVGLGGIQYEDEGGLLSNHNSLILLTLMALLMVFNTVMIVKFQFCGVKQRVNNNKKLYTETEDTSDETEISDLSGAIDDNI
eukprot:317373_1